jgi:hypothetical protein
MQVNDLKIRGTIHSPSRLMLDHQATTPLRSGTRFSGRIREGAMDLVG